MEEKNELSLGKILFAVEVTPIAGKLHFFPAFFFFFYIFFVRSLESSYEDSIRREWLKNGYKDLYIEAPLLKGCTDGFGAFRLESRGFSSS